MNAAILQQSLGFEERVARILASCANCVQPGERCEEDCLVYS